MNKKLQAWDKTVAGVFVLLMPTSSPLLPQGKIVDNSCFAYKLLLCVELIQKGY